MQCDLHTAGTADPMQFSATSESKEAMFHEMGKKHKVRAALLVTVFQILKTELAIKAE